MELQSLYRRLNAFTPQIKTKILTIMEQTKSNGMSIDYDDSMLMIDDSNMLEMSS